jgi:hypothetical protein
MTENEDQRALSSWIAAGLQIPEVRLLKGDAGYLLNNMIAKFSLAADHYQISNSALAQLKNDHVDLSLIHSRSKFYGKGSSYIYEHAIPAGIVRSQLLSIEPSLASVLETLRAAGPVAVLLRSEDVILRNAGLQSKMPSDWSWGQSPLQRYSKSGILLAMETIKVRGSICR